MWILDGEVVTQKENIIYWRNDMDDQVEVNGAKIDKDFFEENLKEARSVNWQKNIFLQKNNHSHCVICQKTISKKDASVYNSSIGWLCNYCYRSFIEKNKWCRYPK